MRDVRRVARLVAPFGACRSSIEPVVVSHSSGSAGSRNCDLTALVHRDH